MPDPFAALPFRTLDPASRDALREQLVPFRALSGVRVLRQGDTSDDDVFVLTAGTVEVIDPSRGEDRVLGRVGEGHYFGERRALFDQPRAYDIRAVTDVEGVRFSGAALRDMLHRSPPFAWSLARILRDKQGLFMHFERFVTEVSRDAGRGYLVIPRLVPLYRRLRPALHRRAGSSEIDFGALDYAIPRLPDGITTTLSLFLTEELPWLYSAPDQTFDAVATQARRRTVYRMMPGKLLVLLRAGMSDLLDLVCCLCVLAVEARKLRRRLTDPAMLASCEHDEGTALPFTPEELERLERLWPGQVRQRLHEIAVHHEDYTISVYQGLGNYDAAKGERWTRQVADATLGLLGMDPTGLPDDFDVHLISSNTHSVTNCLSPWLAARGDAILAWGAEHEAELHGLPWTDPRDRLVALVRPYMKAHPEEEAERKQVDGVGSCTLEHAAFTGIKVQLFDLSTFGDRACEAGLARHDRPGLLINIDYAFGQQADPIMASMVALFGRNLRSVNVLGKAGGLVGRRGDVVVAERFIHQQQDRVISHPVHVDVERLRASLPDRQVFCGPVLTVEGTLLQNDVLLQYYRRLAGCVGLEMEGTWYARQLEEAQSLGMMREDVQLRFLYYISDMPLESGHSLAGAMGLMEGIPPLYACTREVLRAVLEG